MKTKTYQIYKRHVINQGVTRVEYQVRLGNEPPVGVYDNFKEACNRKIDLDYKMFDKAN